MGDNEESEKENRPIRNRKISYSDESETEEPIKLDLGVDIGKKYEKSEEDLGATASTSKEPQKREENVPFSFKHFLRCDVNNYQNLGARPKVYCEGRPISSISDLDLHQITEGKQTRIVPDFSSALPDFVQDHLVMEQSYLAKEHNDYNLEVNNLPNLPDFAPSRSSVNINRLSVETSRDVECRSETVNSDSILDLPVRPQEGFPLDLPVDLQQGRNNSNETDVLNTLPDFLTDGPVRSHANDTTSQNPEREVDRLRVELDACRRDLTRQLHINVHLEKELDEVRNSSLGLSRNLAQAEENLDRCKKHAQSSEMTILNLRKEIMNLNSEISFLRKENRLLKNTSSDGLRNRNLSNVDSDDLARELRSAADSAEQSLRQLLRGVDNLRHLASSVEKKSLIEETPCCTSSFKDKEET